MLVSDIPGTVGICLLSSPCGFCRLLLVCTSRTLSRLICRMRLLISLWRSHPSSLLHLMRRAGIFLYIAVSCLHRLTAGCSARGFRWIKALILDRALYFFLWVILQDDGSCTADRADVIVRSVTASWTLFHFCITIIFLYLIDRKVL